MDIYVYSVFKFPLWRASSLILDISKEGLKGELTQKMPIKVGRSYWLEIPVQRVNYAEPMFFLIKSECRWVASEGLLWGASFLAVDEKNAMYLNSLIAKYSGH